MSSAWDAVMGPVLDSCRACPSQHVTRGVLFNHATRGVLFNPAKHGLAVALSHNNAMQVKAAQWGSVKHQAYSVTERSRTAPVIKLPLVQMVGGLGSGALCAVLVAPLDVVRTRLQVQQASRRFQQLHPTYVPYKGTYHTLSRLYREGGVPNLYRGFGATLTVLPVFWCTFFAGYELCKGLWSNQFPGLGHTGVHLLSASSAGVLTDVLSNPLWVARTRLMTQHMYLNNGSDLTPYRGTVHCLSTMRRVEGIGSWWLGLSATLLGVSHVAIQFPAFEYLKTVLLPVDSWVETHTHRLLGKATQQQTHTDTGEQEPTHTPENGMTSVLLASALSKTLASTMTYPHEVIRSRLQYSTQEFHGFWHSVRVTYRLEGLGAFYNGYLTTLARTVPACCITFVSYHKIVQELERREVFSRWA